MNTYLLSLKRKVSKETSGVSRLLLRLRSKPHSSLRSFCPSLFKEGSSLGKKGKQRKFQSCHRDIFGISRSVCDSVDSFPAVLFSRKVSITTNCESVSFSSENFTSSLFIITYDLRNTLCFAGRPKWTRTTDLVLIRHAL